MAGGLKMLCFSLRFLFWLALRCTIQMVRRIHSNQWLEEHEFKLTEVELFQE